MKKRTTRSTRSGQLLLRALLERLKRGRDVRPTKVRRVRRAVRDHSYENDLKLEVAIDRLSQEMDRI